MDTNLIETLVCKAGCNHQKGCNQVAKVMQEKFADRFVVGIIDADKRKPSYLSCFTEIASSEHIKLFRHTVRPHFMILVHPAIDGFILSCAEAGSIDLTKYELSPALKTFTAQTKNVMSNRDSRFKRLFKAMENVSEIRLMKNIITYLVDTTYTASNDALTAIFDLELV
ncbi:MAG: hypothetical protein NC187_09910 [Candidatus Amulumruptor caecigallinarius]|nr:hypothetical protein [Candidatus Amulumruptor caecigallinarius]MCM1397780.1 hypothetical protein [Candidatus Amulumruptor caecigallinarius]MCM1454819.1 hypothetical protein [bacterium]